MKMAANTRILSFLLQTLLWPLILLFVAVHSTESDILCLRSIKDSLEDPYHYLSSSWDFSNNTEGFICRFTGVDCWYPDENRVMNLKLSNIGLRGQFPRGIQNCASLVGLDLSLNHLSGSIPSDISRLVPFATVIDLSDNTFSGEIPSDIGNCSYLNVLKLDNNRLSGQIPQELGMMSRLKTFTVSDNDLSGPVPVIWNATADSYANNEGLCGGPLASCKIKKSFDQEFKEGVIIGYAFSATSVIVVYMSYCVPWKQMKQRRMKAEYVGGVFSGIRKNKEVTQKAAKQMMKSLPLQLLEKESKEIFALLERVASRLSFAELYDATECFSVNNIIGFGKMGIMYEARLPNAWPLAVKRLSDPQQFKRQFVSEIMILGRYKHRNIVHLLGFCTDKMERILVYKYMSNGRLSKWLHPLESEAARLDWPVRVKIALGIARGLSWLHHGINLHVVHLSLSSECILLDQNFQPRISNFGDAKFLNPNIDGGESDDDDDDLDRRMNIYENNESSEVGYLKKDVHDFGSVLFELMTGKKFDEMTNSSNNAGIANYPLDFYDEIDKSLMGKDFEDEIFNLLKIACDCVQPLPDRRPTMLRVCEIMSSIWEVHRYDDYSEIGLATSSSRGEIVEL